MLVELVTYAANLLRPYLGIASVVAAAAFLTYLMLHAWVRRRPFYTGKPVAPGQVETKAAKLRRTAKARTANGFVGLVDLVSQIFERLSITAALVAAVGFAAVALSAPSTAGAGMLQQAQAALKQSVPAAYGNIADLAAPKVSTVGTKTVYTFTAPSKSSGKAAKNKTYTVTVDKDGSVEVGGEE